MALGKSPRRRKAVASPTDAPQSPGRQRKSAPTKTVSAKGRIKAGQHQHRTLTVDIPTAPCLGNFLSPLDALVAVSYSPTLLAAAARLQNMFGSQLTLELVCRTAPATMSKIWLHLHLCHPSMVLTMLLLRKAPSALSVMKNSLCRQVPLLH